MLLKEFTQKETDQLMHVMKTLAEDISADLAAAGGLYGPRKELLSAYAARVRMPL